MKALVVYYSRTGQTKFVAERIATELEADIEEIVDLKNRKGWIGFLKAGYEATAKKETKIGEMGKSPSNYDLIVVGTPVWNSRPASAIRTYLKINDLSEKKVAVFCTNDREGLEKAIERTKSLMPNATVVGELVVSKALENKESNETKIFGWCERLRSL